MKDRPNLDTENLKDQERSPEEEERLAAAVAAAKAVSREDFDSDEAYDAAVLAAIEEIMPTQGGEWAGGVETFRAGSDLDKEVESMAEEIGGEDTSAKEYAEQSLGEARAEKTHRRAGKVRDIPATERIRQMNPAELHRTVEALGTTLGLITEWLADEKISQEDTLKELVPAMRMLRKVAEEQLASRKAEGGIPTKSPEFAAGESFTPEDVNRALSTLEQALSGGQFRPKTPVETLLEILSGKNKGEEISMLERIYQDYTKDHEKRSRTIGDTTIEEMQKYLKQRIEEGKD